MAPDLRIKPCAACGGDRGWDVPYDIDRTTGALMERWEPCAYCDDGTEEIEVEPVTLEDLDALADAEALKQNEMAA